MSDLISRKAAIKAIRKDMYADKDFMSAMICEGIEDVLNGVPSAEPNEQIKWERDTAIQQLADLGYGLGEKPRRDDCISRKAAIDAVGKYLKKDGDVITIADVVDAAVAIGMLPSAEPERKKGKWIKTRHGYLNGMPIYKCSNCTNFRLSREDGDMIEHYYFTARFPYCPCCGAKMEQEERK